MNLWTCVRSECKWLLECHKLLLEAYECPIEQLGKSYEVPGGLQVFTSEL